MDIPWGAIASFSTAGLSVVAAFGAWRAAHRSAETADAVARIEQDRWHADLLPQFDITFGPFEGDRATLSVHLQGPVPLCQLDEIRIEIVQSDDMSRVVTLPGGPTQEQVDAQVWGPIRFTHGADGAPVGGNTVAPFALAVGKGQPFSVERTGPPHWQQGDDRVERWRSQWLNKPMRLVITCRKEGFKPWVVPYRVDVPQRHSFRGIG
jgi:hypothetical protein